MLLKIIWLYNYTKRQDWKLEHYFAWLLWVGDIVCLENYAHFWEIIAKEVPSLLSSRQLLFEPPLKVHFPYLEEIWDQYWWNNIYQLGAAHSWKRWSQKFGRCNDGWIADQMKSLGMQVEKTKKRWVIINIVSRLMLACSKMTRRNNLNSKILWHLFWPPDSSLRHQHPQWEEGQTGTAHTNVSNIYRANGI